MCSITTLRSSPLPNPPNTMFSFSLFLPLSLKNKNKYNIKTILKVFFMTPNKQKPLTKINQNSTGSILCWPITAEHG